MKHLLKFVEQTNEARRNTISKNNSPQEDDIIKKIGANKTNEKTFDDGIFVTEDGEKSELLGFYTYRGEVCILDSGMDRDFKSYNQDNQDIIYNAIMNDQYTL